MTLLANRTGYWITYASLCKLIMLLGILPFGIRALRKPTPTPPQARPMGEEGIITEEQKAWDREAAHLKLLADSSEPGTAFFLYQCTALTRLP